MSEGILVVSTNRGRYAIDDPIDGSELTSGTVCEIFLSGQWIAGSVEHSGYLYADETTGKTVKGYYFIASNGGVCGLCTGMKVRVK